MAQDRLWQAGKPALHIKAGWKRLCHNSVSGIVGALLAVPFSDVTEPIKGGASTAPTHQGTADKPPHPSQLRLVCRRLKR